MELKWEKETRQSLAMKNPGKTLHFGAIFFTCERQAVTSCTKKTIQSSIQKWLLQNFGLNY